jgi:hypothetical protein
MLIVAAQNIGPIICKPPILPQRDVSAQIMRAWNLLNRMKIISAFAGNGIFMLYLLQLECFISFYTVSNQNCINFFNTNAFRLTSNIYMA